jgi:hypothetical protein
MDEKENYITIKLKEHEDENGNHRHEIVFDGNWKDSHHFLDMAFEAMRQWKQHDHPSPS